MDIYEAIDKRRSVRKFKEKASEDLLKKMVVYGVKALTAGNRQAWEFIIIDDQKMIDTLAEHKYQQNRSIQPKGDMTGEDVENAALQQKGVYNNCSVLAVCCKKGEEVSAWTCIQNMGLVATAEGYGVIPSTFWSGNWPGGRQEEVEKMLGLPEDYQLATVLLVGVQDGEPKEKSMRPDFSWLHRNEFGVKY